MDKIINYHPSTNGAQCMAIMQNNDIGVIPIDDNLWQANIGFGDAVEGETAMIATCRCFVLSRLDVINNVRV